MIIQTGLSYIMDNSKR